MRSSGEHDRIVLRAIRFDGSIGVGDEERATPQPLSVDIVVYLVDADRTSDELSSTLDYSAVVDEVVRVGTTTSFKLMERLAQELATAILALGQLVGVEVTVRKLRPPVEAAILDAGVVITRWVE